MPLFDRLLLAKDLALDGAIALDFSAPDGAAIRGIVLLDLAFDIAARAALDHLGITPTNDRFPALVSALPNFQNSATILDFHRQRNVAQHAGIAPVQAARQQLRNDAEQSLRIVFALAGADYDRFSSVAQIASQYLREPLEEAQTLQVSAPAQAIALTMVTFRRLRGWAEHVLGDATIPSLMWVHDTPRWSDAKWMVKTADNREDYVDGMLRLAAASVLHISVPNWVRLAILGEGHDVRWENETRTFVHANRDAIAVHDVEWAIEVVARATLALEREWPDFHLVPDDSDEE